VTVETVWSTVNREKVMKRLFYLTNRPSERGHREVLRVPGTACSSKRASHADLRRLEPEPRSFSTGTISDARYARKLVPFRLTRGCTRISSCSPLEFRTRRFAAAMAGDSPVENERGSALQSPQIAWLDRFEEQAVPGREGLPRWPRSDGRW